MKHLEEFAELVPALELQSPPVTSLLCTVNLDCVQCLEKINTISSLPNTTVAGNPPPTHIVEEAISSED